MAWFEAVEAAVGGGDADGTSPVGTEGYGEEACGCGVGGAAGGTAGVVMRVVWVERGTFCGVVVRGIYMVRWWSWSDCRG